MNIQKLKKQSQQIGENQKDAPPDVKNSNEAYHVQNTQEEKISCSSTNKELLGNQESLRLHSENSTKSEQDIMKQQTQENILANENNNLIIKDSDNKQNVDNQVQENKIMVKKEQQIDSTEENKNENRALSMLITHSISQMKEYSQQFQQEFQYLSQIQSYQPNTIDQSKKDKYTESATNFKQLVHQFQCWPHQIRDLQHQFELLSKKFVRLQVQIAQRINDHFKITYILKEDDLGELLADNKKICEELEELKQQFKKEKSIEIISVNECISNLTQQFNDIYGTALNEKQIKEIEQFKSEINNFYLERDQQMMELTQKFKETICKLNSLLNEEQFVQLEINEIDKQIDTLKEQQIKIEKDAQCSSDDFKDRKNQKISYISQQSKDYQKEIQDLEIEKGKKEEANLTKFQNSFNQIKDSHSTIQKIFMQSAKDCFHYIILLDQSGSFANAYDSAINGILQFVKNLQNNDFLTVIGFESNSRIIAQKQQVSQINEKNLKEKLRNKCGGGTCFRQAFESLKQAFQNQLNPNEYPIVLFVTDGQDNSNLSNIISDVRNQIEDLVFFTVGYGNQINQKQLEFITNLFNRTNNLTKNINSKQINLFYLNQTPENLTKDIIKISQTKLSIQEIKEAQDLLQETFNKQKQFSENYYTSKILELEKRIQKCVQQEQELIDSQKNLAYFREQSKQYLEQLSQQINSLKVKKFEHQNKIQAIKAEKQTLDKVFYIPENTKLVSIEDKYEYLVQQIHQKADSSIKEVENKMQDIKIEEQKAVEKNKQRVLELGFQNIQQFYKFRELYENISTIQQSSSGIKLKYLVIIDSMIDIGKMLQQNIIFSAINIKNMNKNDTEIRILTYFQKFDPKIRLEDKSDAKKRLLIIQNSSIYNMCLQQKKLDLYENCINNLEFSDLFELVDQEKIKQEKFITKEIIPNIIKKSKQQITNQSQMNNIQNKIDDIQEQIDDTTDENKKERLTKKQEQLEEKLEQLKDKEQDLIADYQDKNYDDIKIVKQITYSFIEAIKCASVELKYQFAVKPYSHYIYNIQNCYKTLKEYENPQLLSNNQNQMMLK